jgi:serine phosphatase RsbU (regulator of sigma subunit)
MQAILSSIRGKLQFSFFVFLLISAFLMATDFWFDAQGKRVQHVLDTLAEINLNAQTAQKLEYIFFEDDVIQERFYQTGQSDNLIEHQNRLSNIQSSLTWLKDIPEIKSSLLKNDLDWLRDNFQKYKVVFAELRAKMQERGFKSYGIEGKMRENIHSLENAGLNPVKVLTIRRHEKDFMLRKQSEYLQKHKEIVASLRAEVSNQTQILTLDAYEGSFKQLAAIEAQIGFTQHEGLKKQLHQLTQQNSKIITRINDAIKSEAANIKTRNGMIQFSLIIGGILLMIFLSIYITRILSYPIHQLSKSIRQVVRDNFSRESSFIKIYADDEIGRLSEDVAYMVEMVQHSIEQIKAHSETVERKQKILMEGMSYAKLIQNAILPDYEMGQYLKRGYFVFYRPLYEVSGDFYWFAELNDALYLAVVDCTGKGVAGAFMSLIGNTLLNEVINEKKIEDPAFILENLSTGLRIALRQDQQRNEDKMDICLCKVEKHPEKKNYKQITFAGANRPLFYSDGWELKELKGVNRAIGGADFIKNKQFTNEIIDLKKGDFLYLTTDGLLNQPDKDQHKFGTTRFKDFLRKIVHQPLEEQSHRLTTEIDHHLSETHQRDDMTVLVVRV